MPVLRAAMHKLRRTNQDNGSRSEQAAGAGERLATALSQMDAQPRHPASKSQPKMSAPVQAAAIASVRTTARYARDVDPVLPTIIAYLRTTR